MITTDSFRLDARWRSSPARAAISGGRSPRALRPPAQRSWSTAIAMKRRSNEVVEAIRADARRRSDRDQGRRLRRDRGRRRLIDRNGRRRSAGSKSSCRMSASGDIAPFLEITPAEWDDVVSVQTSRPAFLSEPPRHPVHAEKQMGPHHRHFRLRRLLGACHAPRAERRGQGRAAWAGESDRARIRRRQHHREHGGAGRRSIRCATGRNMCISRATRS